jgi:AraC-like DNA-binding protein
MDVLSEVLLSVKLRGAVFFNGEFSSPWSFFAPPSRVVAPHVTSSATHLIIYHLLTEGSACAKLASGNRIELAAGDIVIFPHGDAHTLGNGSAPATVDMTNELPRIFSEGLRLSRFGGGGQLTRFVCGYLACDSEVSQILLAGLPPLFKVTIRDDASGRWLENSIRFSVDHAASGRDGGEAVLAKLSEVLFVEALRLFISQLPSEQKGWLAGARDSQVGKALSLMHRNPSHPWTLITLARETAVSRSVLAERFRHFLGESPMSYLTRWRLHLAKQMLASTTCSVAQVATEAGYESQAAFNRAFKRAYGLPPARFRTTLGLKTRSNGAGLETSSAI